MLRMCGMVADSVPVVHAIRRFAPALAGPKGNPEGGPTSAN
jgi:hypothetical protein